jgi:hypothetical protein
MYLPGWLYELKPVAYAAMATVGLTHASLQPLGTVSASLLWLGVARMCYMRVRFRNEHRGYYWHRTERPRRGSARARTSTTASTQALDANSTLAQKRSPHDAT